MESVPISKEDVKNQLSDVTSSLTSAGATGMRRDHESIDDFEHLEPESSPVKETAGKGSQEFLDKLVSIEQESLAGFGRDSSVSGAKAPESQNSSDFSLLSDSKLDSPLAGNNTPDMIDEILAPSGSPSKITDAPSTLKTSDKDFPEMAFLEKKSSPSAPQSEDLSELLLTTSTGLKQEADKLFSKGQDFLSQFDPDPKSAAQVFMTTEKVEMMGEGDVPGNLKPSKFSDDLEFLKHESQHEPSKILKEPADIFLPSERDSSPLPAHVRDDIHDDDSFKDTDSLPELVRPGEKQQIDNLPEDPKPSREEEFEDGIDDDFDIPGAPSQIQLSDKLEQYQTKPHQDSPGPKDEPETVDEKPIEKVKPQVEEPSVPAKPSFTPEPKPSFTPESKPSFTPEPISKIVSEPEIKPTPIPAEPSVKTHPASEPATKTVPPAEKNVPEITGEPAILGALALVVELVYWRDPKKSGILFGSVLGILLSLSYFSLISVVAYLSLAALTGTISYRIYKNVMQALQKTSDGHPFKDILELDLTLPQDKVREVTDNAVAHFNAAAAELRRLFLVEDLVDSIKFGILLWCLTYVGSWFNGMTLIIIAFVALFTLPKVYENNKSQIDQNLEIVRSKLAEITAKVKTFNPIAKKPATEEKKEN